MRARANVLAGFHIAGQDQPGDGGVDVQARVPGVQFAKRRLGDADTGDGGVAGCGQSIDIGLRHEAAIHQLERAVEIGLGQIGIGASHADLGCGAACLLALDRSIDGHQHLALAHPVALIDGDRNDAPALANHANGNLSARADRPGRSDGALDCRTAGRDHGYDGQLRGRIGRGRFVSAASKQEPGDNCRQQHQADNDDPAPAGALGNYRRIECARQVVGAFRGHGCFVIHDLCRPGCVLERPKTERDSAHPDAPPLSSRKAAAGQSVSRQATERGGPAPWPSFSTQTKRAARKPPFVTKVFGDASERVRAAPCSRWPEARLRRRSRPESPAD